MLPVPSLLFTRMLIRSPGWRCSNSSRRVESKSPAGLPSAGLSSSANQICRIVGAPVSDSPVGVGKTRVGVPSGSVSKIGSEFSGPALHDPRLRPQRMHRISRWRRVLIEWGVSAGVVAALRCPVRPGNRPFQRGNARNGREWRGSQLALPHA